MPPPCRAVELKEREPQLPLRAGEFREDSRMIVEETARARKELQDAIYRERILRARAMTPGERLEEAFELSNYSFNLMLDGAMQKLRTADEEAGWQQVEKQIARLAKMQECSFGPTYEPVPS